MEAQDHDEQMQLGFQIIATASRNKIDPMEQEIRSLKLSCEEQRSDVAVLQRQTSSLEVELVWSHQQGQQLAEEHEELFNTVRNLQKQIDRLERLKQAMHRHRADDDSWEAELGDARALMSDEYLLGATPLTVADTCAAGSGAAAARRSSAASPSPANSVAAAPPLEPVAATGGAQAPPSAGSLVTDAKEFFRRAKSRLSPECFKRFVASVKRLNKHEQTREETLEEARDIFGPELADLCADFAALLERHTA